MAAADPWLWSQEELVRQVCRSTHLFDAVGYRQLPHLDPLYLVEDFERTRTTGREFLNLVNAEALRSAFRTCSVDHSRALFSVIELLRSRSALYQIHVASTRAHALALNNNDSTPPQLQSGSIENALPDTQGRRRLKTSNITTERLPSELNNDQHRDRSANAAHAQEPTSNDWGHLRHWEREVDDDEIVEMDGLEDDMDEDELAVDVSEEEEADVLQEPRRPGKLSEEEVVDIINERIDSFTQQWQPGKGEDAAHQPDTFKLWEDAEAKGCRQEMAEKKQTDIEYYEARLDRISEEIMRAPWNTIDEVRRVCGNLETTVDLLEESKWLLSIYNLEPVHDNDDNQDANDDGHTTEGDARELSRGLIEIIDLGSGSESDPDEMIIDTDYAAEVPMDTSSSSNTAARRISTPESIVDDLGKADALLSNRQPHGQLPQSNPSVIQHGRHPESASIHAVSQWKMDELVAKADRKRIIMKVVHGMRAEDRELIRTRVDSVRKQDLLMEILPCVNMLSRRETKMRGVLPKDTYKIVAFTRLFLCWWLTGDFFNEEEPTEWRLEELADTLESGCADLDLFYYWIRHILSNTFSENALKTPDIPSQAEIIVISDDED